MHTNKEKFPARRGHALRANAVFALLTVLILAAGAACAVRASSLLTAPSGQVDTFASLPVYNVIGQRTERVEFWPRARYHDRAQALGYPLPYTTSQAFEENSANLILQDLLLNSDWEQELMLSLSGRQTEDFACYVYQHDNVVCRFYDNIPVQITCTGEETPFYEGVMNSSSGRMISTGRRCYSALITPAASMPAPTEEQYQQAYQTLLEHLLLLTGAGNPEPPYYCNGQLVFLLNTLQVDLPFAAPSNLGADMMEDVEWTGELSYAYSTLELFCSTLLNNFQKNDYLLELSPWEQIDWPEPDPDDPEAMERFLQEYYATIYGIDLQILRQEGCYLVLFQQGERTLGLYFDPLLQAYSGFGIQ